MNKEDTVKPFSNGHFGKCQATLPVFILNIFLKRLSTFLIFYKKMENIVNFEQFRSPQTTSCNDEGRQLQPSLTYSNCDSAAPLTVPSMNLMSSMLQQAAHYSSAPNPSKLCKFFDKKLHSLGNLQIPHHIQFFHLKNLRLRVTIPLFEKNLPRPYN